MTLLAALALFVVMLVLAGLPSASVALVVTRSAALGIRNGAAVAAGIVIGDLVFVSLAILGMSILAETMGAFFAIFKYAGGIYLIWFGVGLLRAKREVSLRSESSSRSTLLTSFASGLILTLGDVKAILFYASLFPAFVDLAQLTMTGAAVIVSVTIVTVGGVKLAYAFAAQRIVSRLRSGRGQKRARVAAGGLMIGTGTYLLLKT